MRTSIAFGFAGALAFVAAGAAGSASSLDLCRFALGGAALATAAYIDLREHRIPNVVVVPATAVCLILAVAAGASAAAIAGAFAIVLALAALPLARPDALGMGDVKLALLVALALDGDATAALVFGLALATFAGLVLVAIRGRVAFRIALPLAPFICVGALAALVA